MTPPQVHHYHGYHYQILSRTISSGEHQGIITVLAYDETFYPTPVEITTPVTFKKYTAAQIEASALAFELINSGAISVLVPETVDKHDGSFGMPTGSKCQE